MNEPYWPINSESFDELYNDSPNMSYADDLLDNLSPYGNNGYGSKAYEDKLQETRDRWLGRYAEDTEKWSDKDVFDPGDYHNDSHLNIASPLVTNDVAAEYLDRRTKDDLKYMGYIGEDLKEDFSELIENALQNSKYEPFEDVISPHGGDTNSNHSHLRGDNNYFMEGNNMSELKNVTATVRVFDEPKQEGNRLRLGTAAVNVNGVSVKQCSIVQVSDFQTGEPKIIVNLPDREKTNGRGEKYYAPYAAPVGEHSKTVMDEIRDAVTEEYMRVSAMPVKERDNAYDFKNPASLEKSFVGDNPSITINRMGVNSNPQPKQALAFFDVTVGNMKLSDMQIRMSKDNNLYLDSNRYPTGQTNPETGQAAWTNYVSIVDKGLYEKVMGKVVDRFEKERESKTNSRAHYVSAAEKAQADAAKQSPDKNNVKDKGAKAER